MGTEAGGGSLVSMLIMIGLMIVLFYFMLIRPQNKRQKQVRNMLDNLAVGDRVMTIGRIYGRITKINDNVITLEVGPDKVALVIDREGIAKVEDSDVENDMKDAPPVDDK
jgi:preprotein translocase subunit YajC